MLRVRDEKRRMRHVEMLRQQKEVGEDEAEACSGGGRVELLGDMDEEQGSVLPSVKATSKPQPPPKTASYSPTSSTNITNRQVRLKLCGGGVVVVVVEVEYFVIIVIK